jgi:tRNA pseudouridine38-40 synthase
MTTWKLTVEYDGTRYYGWQEQKNARTVAGELRSAAEQTFSRSVDIAGAGRTDAGVHALAQIVRLRVDGRQKRREVLFGLNDRLPTDINILTAEETRPNFDPRKDAKARYYIYQISTRRSAFAKRFVWWLKDSLDVDSMKAASLTLVGHHDFSRFSDKRTGDRSSVVLVNNVQLEVAGELLLFRIGASHFLWKMVRRIVGALVEVGRGSITVDDFTGFVDSRPSGDRSNEFNVASWTAPPSGLFLERIVYDEDDDGKPLAPAFPVQRF